MIEIKLRDIISNSDTSRESSPRLQGLGYGIIKPLPGSDKPTLFALALGDEAARKEYCDLVERYDEGLVYLAQSLDKHGQLTNCRMRPAGKGKYAIVFGCRRMLGVLYLQAKSGGKTPATVWATVATSNGKDTLIESAAENANRLPPSPIDQGRLFERLKKQGMSVTEIGRHFPMGKVTEQNIRRRIRLLQCADDVILKVHHGTMTMDAALKLLGDEPGKKPQHIGPVTDDSDNFSDKGTPKQPPEHISDHGALTKEPTDVPSQAANSPMTPHQLLGITSHKAVAEIRLKFSIKNSMDVFLLALTEVFDAAGLALTDKAGVIEIRKAA